MSLESLHSIPIRLDFQTAIETDHIRSFLSEIKQALIHFSTRQENHQIDLMSSPLTGLAIEQLLSLLGKGEIVIHLSSLGESEIYETVFSGVWVVRHKNEQGDTTSLLIEIGTIPAIVLTPVEDLKSMPEQVQQLMDHQLNKG